MATRSVTAKPGARQAEQTARLHLIPSVDECQRTAEERALWPELSLGYVTSAIRKAQTLLRQNPDATKESPDRRAAIDEVLRLADQIIRGDQPRLRRVINATGVIIHTNLGRALLAESAIDAIAEAARSPSNLEYDLSSGQRGDRDDLVEELLRDLTGAEAATVVNNNAAAVLLALNSLAEGREVIASRGELIEIGGSFRIPDVMAKSAARLREVGTTNRTHLKDYADAIGPETALLLKVHPSNYRVVGFTAAVELRDLVKLAHENGLEVMEDLGSGALVDLGPYGLAGEPVVAGRIAAGVGLVTFSGDKLLGGPQAGIIAGRKELISKLKRNPLKRALRCDKLTLAALSATLRIYLRDRQVAEELPVIRLLARKPAELEAVGKRGIAILRERLGDAFQIEMVTSKCEVGSGAQPGEQLESRALRISHSDYSPEKIATLFRAADPPIIGRITAKAFQLDLRTIENPEDLAAKLP